MIAVLKKTSLRIKRFDNFASTAFSDKNIRLHLYKRENTVNNVVMPKKSTKNLRDSRIGKRLEGCKIPTTEVIVKQFRSIHVNVKNAKRWFMLKKRLALVTDDELVVYLLDLAEPIIRRDGKCSRSGDWKADQDKENDLEVIKMDERDLPNAEEPLRRSPRKQCIVSIVASESVLPVAESPEVSKTQHKKFPEIGEPENRSPHSEKRRSRIKHHHKTKEKHHRDKRAKRKHSKNTEDAKTAQNDERSVLSRVKGDAEELNATSKNTNLPSVPKIIVERLSLENKQPIIVFAPSDGEKNSILAENLNKSKRSSIDNDPILVDRSIESEIDGEKSMDFQSNSEVDNSREISNDSKSNIMDNTNEDEHRSRTNDEIYTRTDSEVVDKKIVSVSSRKKIVQEKRSRKRHKHNRHDSSLEKDEKVSTMDEAITSNPGEILHKRRKKKHKRASSSTDRKTKKFHDVRKAPQDGLIDNAKTIIDDNVDQRITDDIIDDVFIEETNVKAPTELVGNSIGEFSEPHRLAIKIKLCQDCNNRHVKDTCPLMSTDNRVEDRVSYDDWLTKHESNPEVAKAIATEDPISEGYIVTNDDNYESEDEIASTEQAKSKTKNDSEDKQLHVNDDRPLYSRESLPDCFELKLTNPEHGIGIYASNSLQIYTKFGPLVGNPIREKDIPDDFSMRHLWEIDDDGKISYISTTNPLKSNWIRYMRPADTKEDKNVTVVTKNGQLYFVTTQNISKGTELTYWADSQSSAWTRKNKIDKTNCGGCNLNFTHSIYYRLHCCIFHDTRYSLTIRKYHCKVCGAAVLGKDNIMKHAADLHGGRGAYQCQYCRKFFLRLNYLEMHRTYGCSQNPQRSRPLCDFCGRKFCQPQKLKVHIKRMHSDMSEVLREFQCKMCLKLLGSRAALQRHMKEVHHKDVVGAATCDRCGKMFQNKSNLKIHMLTHSGVKPFKCKETDCKAAFTTKQCLQFHYKKVHGLSEDMMPKIERSVAYTFDAYSGGLVEGIERRKTTKSDRRASQQENSNSVTSLEDCSSEHSSRMDVSMSSFQPTSNEFDDNMVSTPRYNLDRYILDRNEQESDMQGREIRDTDLRDCDMENGDLRDRQERDTQDHEMNESEIRERDIEEAEKREREMQEHELQECEMRDREILQSSPSPIPPNSHQEVQISGNESSLENDRTDVDFYGARLQSKGSKKWMGQFNNLNEPEIVTQHHSEATRSDVYEFSDMSMKKSEDRGNAMMSGSNIGLNIYRRPESTNASLLVEAALDAAERDIGAVTSPMIDDNDRDTNIYTISSQLQTRQTDNHLDPYIQQEDELMSSSSMNQNNRKTPNSHVHLDYHLHRPVDYINSPRAHSMEQYLPQDVVPRVGSPGAYNIHMEQEELPSPSATPSQNRYQEIHHHHHLHHQQQQQEQQQQQQQQQQHHHHHHPNHHQVPADNLSSDEGDSVAQNLSISVKEKSLQLELPTSYKYEQLDVEFPRDRTNFEPIILNNGELQGLDMSARSYHHTLGSQIANSRYHHHHLYEITERQSVDLSRNTGYSISPPPSSSAVSPPAPPPYPHNEVLRIVSLDLTPGQSVDLSVSRSHHLHSASSRIITGSPQPSGSSSASHVVPDTVEGRILPSPPPLITGYNGTYPVSPAAYHPPRAGYHHYSGYY